MHRNWRCLCILTYVISVFLSVIEMMVVNEVLFINRICESATIFYFNNLKMIRSLRNKAAFVSLSLSLNITDFKVTH